ncbi:MAG TPA: hypothetical protein VLF69_00395 [Candidatus Saccharimonadales bacterium]|nr:hypothetical protein [Candidatus Saccharimonadales bacterium]
MALLAIFLSLIFSLFVTTSAGTQSKAQDAERQTDINSMDAHLEAYYANNGYYPTFADINNASWRHQNMVGLDDEALKDPAGTASALASAPGKHTYSYKVTGNNGEACNNTTVDCAAFVLTATLGSGQTFTKRSFD